MILPISSTNTKINFSANEKEQKALKYTHDTVLPNNIANRSRIALDKLTNAFTLYPAKGLKGNKNSNFYEFLTMGTVPYLIGSGMLMGVFNYASKHYPAFAKDKAGPIGKKLAMGVVLYGIAKQASKSLVNFPVRVLTGVDANLPYAKVNYELPDDIYDTDITSIEYHKVFESVEFPRWDLLYRSEAKGEKRNAFYDKVAHKLGLGDNLNDSDQEVKPLIKEIIVKSNTAKNISSYLWAAAAVGLAFQDPWNEFFEAMDTKFYPNKAEKDTTKRIMGNLSDRFSLYGKRISSFGNSFVNSAKELFMGAPDTKGIAKHGGKLLLFTALASSIWGVLNVVNCSQKPSKLDASDIIKKDRKYVVN